MSIFFDIDHCAVLRSWHAFTFEAYGNCLAEVKGFLFNLKTPALFEKSEDSVKISPSPRDFPMFN